MLVGKVHILSWPVRMTRGTLYVPTHVYEMASSHTLLTLNDTANVAATSVTVQPFNKDEFWVILEMAFWMNSECLCQASAERSSVVLLLVTASR